jgi:sulfur-oxidizing protein SoxA
MVMTFVSRTKAIAFKHCLMLSAGGLSACGLFTFWAFWTFWAQNAWATTSSEHQLSGNHFLSPSLKSMQSDASLNPVSLWLDQGRNLWGSAPDKQSCYQCHGDVQTLKFAAPQHPKWSARLNRLVNLEDQIVSCSERTSRPLRGLENPDVLALSALIHKSSQGLPFKVSAPPNHAQQWQTELNAGAQLFTTRKGAMNLACTHCHDLNIGKQMRADIVSPGHPTGFPIFKMSWQSMGSIDRRLRACFSGVQAEVPAPGSIELRRLELFLKSRSQGLPIDGPSLRR